MNQKYRVLIFTTVWPEPQSSAAGVRLMQWVNLFVRWGYEVTLSSPSLVKEKSDWGYFMPPPGVQVLPLPLNRVETESAIKLIAPDLVLFDRFILEEQFGHQVYSACPQAVILLETQDLHLVRRARESVKEEWPKVLSDRRSPSGALAVNYRTDTAVRETASIYRCDYSFVVSSYEAELLKNEFGVGEEWVQWLPFLYEQPIVTDSSAWRDSNFQERNGFCWVGNFRHAPNGDGLKWFLKEVWPLIRQKLPKASISIWGAYPSAEVMQFKSLSQGIEVKGQADHLDFVFANARVNLAPLRFGAGIKGKILEGFRYGLPVVTTSVGAEGLLSNQKSSTVENFDENLDENLNDIFGGMAVDLPEAFAAKCIELHENETAWKVAQGFGKSLIESTHSLAVHEVALKKKIENLLDEKRKGILPKWLSQIGRHEQFNSHRYFSKWIELKETM